MANPVLVEDLEPRFRSLTPQEKEFATALLADAWEELLARIPDLETRLDTGAVTPGLARRVVAAMVVRVLRNPEAIRQWQVDDGSFTRDQAVSAGFLFASPEELALLRGTPDQPVGHIAFSVSMGWGR